MSLTSAWSLGERGVATSLCTQLQLPWICVYLCPPASALVYSPVVVWPSTDKTCTVSSSDSPSLCSSCSRFFIFLRKPPLFFLLNCLCVCDFLFLQARSMWPFLPQFLQSKSLHQHAGALISHNGSTTVRVLFSWWIQQTFYTLGLIHCVGHTPASHVWCHWVRVQIHNVLTTVSVQLRIVKQIRPLPGSFFGIWISLWWSVASVNSGS